jgi:hypothetical protein
VEHAAGGAPTEASHVGRGLRRGLLDAPPEGPYSVAMPGPDSTLSQGVVIILAALPFAGIVALLVVRARRRRKAAAALTDDPDYELVFPEGPRDQPGERRTKVGRSMTRR